VPVQVPAARGPTPSDEVAREVGRLLAADPRASKEAETRLVTLDERGRKALAEQAKRIPGEHDPRWLNVLDENQMLPELAPDRRVEFLLWKAARPEPFYSMKAQSGLLATAHAEPDVLIERLRRGVREGSREGIEPLVVALGVARSERAVPVLLALYRTGADTPERRAAAEALALIAGEERRPRVAGTSTELARDASTIEDWYRSRSGGGSLAERRGFASPRS
jgi:hypothetical protein